VKIPQSIGYVLFIPPKELEDIMRILMLILSNPQAKPGMENSLVVYKLEGDRYEKVNNTWLMIGVFFACTSVHVLREILVLP
jgi:hypothetical protein